MLMGMTFTELATEWTPNFVKCLVKSCYARTFVLTFQIPYFYNSGSVLNFVIHVDYRGTYIYGIGNGLFL